MFEPQGSVFEPQVYAVRDRRDYPPRTLTETADAAILKCMNSESTRVPKSSSAAPDSLKSRYGPWAVIAGASEGLGAEFARHLAAAGINCVLVARRAQVLDRLAAELRQEFGIEAIAAPIDLAEPTATERMLAAVGDRPIGLFIFNAGGDGHATKYLDKGAQNWMPLVRRNVLTLMESVHAFGARMVSTKRGGILLVGSDAAFGGVSRLGVYSATKAFGLNLGESLWAELAPKGVDVLNLIIGATDTPTLREVLRQRHIPVESLVLARASEVVPAALARLGAGPTLIYGFADDDSDTVKSSGSRRKRILDSGKFLSLFFGEDS
jgi:short-subunit dehydrogenase